MEYLILFLEGIITFVSPCLLPMLPIYISYFASGEDDRKKTFINAIGFVLGFTIVFVILGAFAGSIGNLLSNHTTIINLVTGLIVIIFGLNFTGLIRIGFLNGSKKMKIAVQNGSFIRTVIFGIVFSIGWTPCVGAFLGSALLLASQTGSVLHGILMLVVYSMGLGIPFIISALLISRLKGTFDFIKKHYKIINWISGIFLIIVGIFMMTGGLGYLLRLLSF